MQSQESVEDSLLDSYLKSSSALTGLAVAHNLIHVKKVKDQSSLDAIERQQNIYHSFTRRVFIR
jgi:hypothetical protein